MMCQQCKEAEAEYNFGGFSCCGDCLREEVRDTCMDEAIDQYIENNARRIKE